MNSTITDNDSDNTNTLFDSILKKNYEYPLQADPAFQYKIYTKREFYYNRIKERPLLENYDEIREHRDKVCGSSKIVLQEQQRFLGNFMNPNTPYKGILVFHGVGTGKCVLADTIIPINTSADSTDNTSIQIKDLWDNYKCNNTSVEISVPKCTEINCNCKDIFKEEWSCPKKDIFTYSINNENRIVKTKIKYLYRQYIDEIMRKITIVDNNNKEYIISMTYLHKLYKKNTYTSSGEWDSVLSINDEVGLPLGFTIIYGKIKSIEKFNHIGYVYDLEINTYHNYIANNICTHNTCAAVSIAEKFKDLVLKYNTKIHILVPGPNIRETWRSQILSCTGETYFKQLDKSIPILDAPERKKIEKMAVNNAMQYYRFMSYKGFYKRVLGEKIIDKKDLTESKAKLSYRKTDQGDYERDVSYDRIYNLDNSVIIVDEAHNLTGKENKKNEYGEALKKVIKESSNLKVILLTATPMKNLADDIIELLNFIRPHDSQIERDKVFTSNRNHLMDFKVNGLDYLKNMSSGYISYLRGGDPLTFAMREEKGDKLDELLYTKVVKCKMLEFQLKAYREAVKTEDTLSRHTSAVSNVVFPGIDSNTKDLIGYYGNDGIDTIKSQIKNNDSNLNKQISTKLLKVTDTDLVELTRDNRTITGKIFTKQYLKIFSIKFYKALKKLDRLVWNKKGASLAFIYSNVVKVGINIFREVLLQNGYIEYDEIDSNMIVNNDTKCYYCGISREKHGVTSDYKKIDSESSTDEDNYHLKSTPPLHEYYPATFITITGQSTDESAEAIPEDKQRLLKSIYNNYENREGKYIKFVLGSRVMNEGISLKNVSEIHILDAYYNLGRIEQVIGRGLRHCSHYNLMNEKNQFPKVKIYKYVVSLDGEISTEIELYKKAEIKHILIKKVERALKEIAIDCPLNLFGNVFKEDIEQFKNCKVPDIANKKEETCPAICDYMTCDYKCSDSRLNAELYDPNRKIYKYLSKDNLDFSTFTNELARGEIENIKTKIKELYILEYSYNLNDISDYIKKSYTKSDADMYDEFFVFKALDEMIPITENDFNNFSDTVLDKYDRPGYLIFVNNYYLFQPFDLKENVPMHYRTSINKPENKKLTLYSYIKNNETFKKHVGKESSTLSSSDSDKKTYQYNYDVEYYLSKNENDIVGVIDKESINKKSKHPTDLNDIFKLRPKRKIIDKSRGTGIPSFKGADCTTKSMDQLLTIAKNLNITSSNDITRADICPMIRDSLFHLEKYSNGKNKITYMMIPNNHSLYAFPYNLEDRADAIIHTIREIDSTIKIEKKLESTKLKSKKVESKKVECIKYMIILEYPSVNKNIEKIVKTINSKYKTKIDKKFIKSTGFAIIVE